MSLKIGDLTQTIFPVARLLPDLQTLFPGPPEENTPRTEITEGNADGLADLINTLPPDVAQRLNDQIFGETGSGRLDYPTALNLIQTEINNMQVEDIENLLNQQLAIVRDTSLSSIDQVEESTRQKLARYTGDATGGRRTVDANILFKDPEIAPSLNVAEQSINNSINAARIAASAQNANSGIRSSGKVTDAVGQAEMAGAGQIANVRSGVLGDTQRRVDSLGDQLDQIPFLRTEAEQNQFGNILSTLPGFQSSLEQTVNLPSPSENPISLFLSDAGFQDTQLGRNIAVSEKYFGN